MTLLTQRAFRVFAVLESYRAGSADIRDAILPFFEPILAELDGQILSPVEFANRIRQAYRWNFTADVVEELIPSFENRNWVKLVSGTGKRSVYRVSYDSLVLSPPGPSDVEIGQILLVIAENFGQFIDEISPLSSYSRSTEDLAEILIEWLVSIDAYNEEILQHQTNKTSQQEDKLGSYINLPNTSALGSEERYLCARFVKHLFELNSPYIQNLCKIASVGLLTEVIQDFRHPVTAVSKTNLVVYLDGPVALDLLGTSGSAAAENIRTILRKFSEIGGTILIFQESVEELTKALIAVLKRSPPERTGATADAIRRNETDEAYVRQVAIDPETQLSHYNVGVTRRDLDQEPREHEYFTRKQYDDLFSRMHWHSDVRPRAHDSTIVALVQRMRRGHRSRDIFKARCLLVTRNGALAQLARQFCLDQNLLPSNAVGPAIHQRQLAMAIWLRTGLTDDEQEIPRRYVLAACERVLELKTNIVDHVRMAARNLTPEKAEQLELLLTQDRSVQVLMDKTLGVSNVISAENIEQVIDVMKRGIAADIEKGKEAEVEEIQRAADTRVREAHKKKDTAENRIEDLQSILAKHEKEDLLSVERLLEDVNNLVRRRYYMIHWGVALLVFTLGFLPLLIQSLAGWAKVVTLIVAGLFAAVLGLCQILDRPMNIKQKLEYWSFRKLEELAKRRGLEEKLARFEVFFANKELSVAPPSKTFSGSSRFEIGKEGSLSRDERASSRDVGGIASSTE